MNVLLTKDNECKIADFGLAKAIATTITISKKDFGTPHYMAPELFAKKGCSYKSDIWALGVILYRMCMFKLPFDDTNIFTIYKAIENEDFEPCPDGRYSEVLLDLQQKMLMKNEKDRPSIEEILVSLPIIKSVDSTTLESNTKEDDYRAVKYMGKYKLVI